MNAAQKKEHARLVRNVIQAARDAVNAAQRYNGEDMDNIAARLKLAGKQLVRLVDQVREGRGL